MTFKKAARLIPDGFLFAPGSMLYSCVEKMTDRGLSRMVLVKATL